MYHLNINKILNLPDETATQECSVHIIGKQLQSPWLWCTATWYQQLVTMIVMAWYTNNQHSNWSYILCILNINTSSMLPVTSRNCNRQVFHFSCFSMIHSYFPNLRNWLTGFLTLKCFGSRMLFCIRHCINSLFNWWVVCFWILAWVKSYKCRMLNQFKPSEDTS